MPTFFLTRHGLTDDDMPGKEKVTGVLQVPLNEQGRRNAALAGRFLKSKGITSITSSDIKRARQTADIISDQLGLPVVESEKLRSWDMGSIQGMFHGAARPFLTFFQENYDLVPPKGEKFSRFYRAFKGAWDTTVAYVKRFPEARPLLITHSQDLALCKWFIAGTELGNALGSCEGVPPGGVVEINVNGDKITMRKIRG